VPIIKSKYFGKCRVCKSPYFVGDSVFWQKGIRGVTCLECRVASPAPIANSTPEPKEHLETFVVEWADLKEKTRALLRGEKVCQRVGNQNIAEEHTSQLSEFDSWRGYGKNDLSRWIERGFSLPGLDMTNPLIPIREKRRLIFAEEGEELHLDLAYSGIDEHFSLWTKRETIPGLAIRINHSFASSMSANVVNAYFSWLCRALYALETSGVDCDVTMVNSVNELWGAWGSEKRTNTVIRVKRENEATDFSSWSPMLSPASLRSLGFVAMCLHGDAAGQTVNASLGSPKSHSFSVKWNEETRLLEIDCTPHGIYEFPETDMTAQLHKALQAITH